MPNASGSTKIKDIIAHWRFYTFLTLLHLDKLLANLKSIWTILVGCLSLANLLPDLLYHSNIRFLQSKSTFCSVTNSFISNSYQVRHNMDLEVGNWGPLGVRDWVILWVLFPFIQAGSWCPDFGIMASVNCEHFNSGFRFVTPWTAMNFWHATSLLQASIWLVLAQLSRLFHLLRFLSLFPRNRKRMDPGVSQCIRGI